MFSTTTALYFNPEQSEILKKLDGLRKQQLNLVSWNEDHINGAGNENEFLGDWENVDGNDHRVGSQSGA